MADGIVILNDADPLPFRALDNGDGTFSLAVKQPGSGGIATTVTANAGTGTFATSTADGANAALGTTTDPAVASDANGTLSGKLRGLVKILADVWDSTNHRLKVDGSAVTQPVSAASLPLPTGAATAANQTTSNTSLASLDTKLPAKGQAAMAASTPVVVASDQTTLPVADVKGTASAPAAVNATATAGQLLGANANRKTAMLQNRDSANHVYIGKDNTVTAANGIDLPPGGGMFVDDRTTGAWYGICSSGQTASVAILEIS
jgi:hypothetical protein